MESSYVVVRASDGGYVDVKITCKDAFSEPPLRV